MYFILTSKLQELKIVRWLKHKRDEIAFYTPKGHIKKEIERELGCKIKLKPVLEGNGYTTKYIVFAGDKKYFLKVANKFAEWRIRKIHNRYNRNYGKLLLGEYNVLIKLSKLNFAPSPVLFKKTFLLMEFIEGKKLSEVLITEKNNIFKNKYIRNTLNKLAEINKLGIIWSDLSTSNVFIRNQREIFIDFEISFREDYPQKDELYFSSAYFLRALLKYKYLYNREVYKIVKQFTNNYSEDIQRKLKPILEKFRDGN